jgi:intraflagellar transport protein 140
VRKRETYILAGNFLQTQNPRAGTEVFDTIVTFYRKAEAFDKVAKFHEASAQVEMDEYQEYQKGLELMKAARDILVGKDGIPGREQMVNSLSAKIRWIELYLDATGKSSSDPKKSLGICVDLLKSKGIETCLRPDDIYMVMVQCYVAQNNFGNAYKILEDLRANGTDLTWFMDLESLNRIYKAVGQVFVQPSKSEVDEDIVDVDDIEDV